MVLVSPSVGTGVDITFPNNETHIDSVYGFFEAKVNSHFDIDQQLARVRHPGKVNVWISPQTFRFEIDPSVIKEEIRYSTHHARKLVGIDDDGTLKYDEVWDGKYLDLYTNVKSLQRGSSNHLLYHFKKMKTYNGCQLLDDPNDGEFFLKGSMITRAANYLHFKETQQEIITARLITKDQYSALKMLQDRSNLTPDQQWAMRRYEIESFYLLDVSEDLIETDREGDTRTNIHSYETYMSDNDLLVKKDLADHKQNRHITDRNNYAHHRELLYALLTAAGLADEHFITAYR